MSVDRTRDSGVSGMFKRKKKTESAGGDFSAYKNAAIRQGKKDKKENSAGAKIASKIGESIEKHSTTVSGKNLGKAMQGKK